MNLILLFFTYKYKGNWDEIFHALEKKERVSLTEIKLLEKKINDEKIKYFTILDDVYPENFKNVYKPPFVIFYMGNLDILQNNNYITLTGDNELNSSEKKIVHEFSEPILKKHDLITNLYKGTDQLVAQHAIENESKIIFVSANGINEPYSSITQGKFNFEKCLFISEYPDTHVDKNKLRARNRLIAVMSNVIVLLNSKKGSGTMNLVTHGLNLGKEIMCVPDSIKSNSGNNELIKQGATLVTKPSEILKFL